VFVVPSEFAQAFGGIADALTRGARNQPEPGEPAAGDGGTPEKRT
jgi:hypothetical protein